MFHRLIFAAAAAMCLSTVAAPAAQAAVSEPEIRIKVRFTDLDIGTDAGAREVLRRIKVAAETICGPAPDRRELAATGVWEACVSRSVNRAVADLGSARVAALISSSRRSTIAAAH
ncbi:MAG TPA: UrcA family protein [Caulobacteraceae bacterium]|nr:UrcA family protein [Caulobacteraceae bacterium]